VTLGRVVFAWIVVAAWFAIATVVTLYVVARLVIPPDARVYLGIPTHVLKRRLAEAALITLIASLWFNSLGSSDWWLLFLLIGGLVSSGKWFARGPDLGSKRVLFTEVIADLVRYVIAGALLAWRLS
jgi:hypothetical protein